MKICHLVPGSGGTFYCQNCLRDYSLVRALRRAGHDAHMLPLYLPPFGDDAATASETPVFFGGISVYLRHHVPIFRRAPRWVDRLLDAPWLLKLAASREGSTNAATLGPMTISMLEGRAGFQHKEFDRLVDWIATDEKPDLIHISNALLLSLATEIKRVCDVPILCSLQDEEPWVEAMGAPYNRLCWEAMARHARHVSRFVATSAWYADRMADRIGLARDQIAVVFPGVEVDTAAAVATSLEFDPPTIGFLSRINEHLGFSLLVDAFIELKQEPALRGLRLRASGGCTPADRPYVNTIMKRLRKFGFEDSLEIVPKFEKTERGEFLRSLSVLSTPVPQGEAFGVQLIEAMAWGVPVVQPRAGAYPEIVDATGGGILYDPANPRGLADALRTLLGNPEEARALGEHGRAVVLNRFNIERAAAAMAALYEELLR